MLALTERPFTFENLLGHDNIKKTFKNYFKHNNIPQVMFMLGNSGTGKSSFSRIVSASLNCKNKKEGDYNPCGECHSCLDIMNEKFSRDIILINGGDVGKEDVNAIKERISFAPMYDTNKIVILEEGHLITKNGKEQTLLLLEKTRENVYFIVVSTEKQLFIDTVLDRGQIFDFKPVDTMAIAEHLNNLLDKYDPEENVPEEFIKGIFTIAENCKGSVRKAIADFDRCLNSEIYSPEDIINEFGYISEKKLYELFSLLISKDKLFFDEINRIDINHFFYYTWKIIMNSEITGLTVNRNDTDLSFTDQCSFSYLESKNFSKLKNIYMETYKLNSHSYKFNKNVFYHYLTEYYKENNIPVLNEVKNKNEPIVKRRKRR